jgi:hypothetical protein
VTKSEKMGCAGHEERKRNIRRVYKILVTRRWENNIKININIQCARGWTGFSWLRIAASGEHGNELPGSVKGVEFLDYLSDCQLLKNGALRPSGLQCC